MGPWPGRGLLAGKALPGSSYLWACPFSILLVAPGAPGLGPWSALSVCVAATACMWWSPCRCLAMMWKPTACSVSVGMRSAAPQPSRYRGGFGGSIRVSHAMISVLLLTSQGLKPIRDLVPTFWVGVGGVSDIAAGLLSSEGAFTTARDSVFPPEHQFSTILML